MTSLDAEVESNETSLVGLIAQIREALGIELKDRFKDDFAKMHPLAAEYSIGKLDSGGTETKGATTWGSIRGWLLKHGLIFTQPLTRTTSYVQDVVQPQAYDAAVGAIEEKSNQLGFEKAELEQKQGKLVNKMGEDVVDDTRSLVNAGAQVFSTSKLVLQEFAFTDQVRPFLTLRSAYMDSNALAREMGLGEVQLHHLVTENMVKLLRSTQPHLNPQALRDNQRYQYMSSPGGHIGYQKWHRHYDATMAAFIIPFPPGQMTVDDLVIVMHNYYQSDHGMNITKRIPGVSLI